MIDLHEYSTPDNTIWRNQNVEIPVQSSTTNVSVNVKIMVSILNHINLLSNACSQRFTLNVAQSVSYTAHGQNQQQNETNFP